MIRRRRAIRRSDLPAESNGRCDEGWDALFPGRLLRWYAARKRDLPWRRTRDPYRVWVSEIMLQQTTVGAVIPYYNAWLRAFPDLQTLARAPLQKVLKAWEGLGYYQRARNMRRTARIIRDRCGGRFPEDPADLAALPGFGPYTAAAVASLAFHRPVPVVEANVRRVMTRMLGLAGPPGAGRDAAIARFLEKRISRRSPGNFNQAMMEWGALVCRPKNPLCLKCPGQNFCRAFARGEQDVLPAPKTLRPKDITAVVAVIRKNGRVLLQKRPETGLLAGLWEFPGGKVEAGETLRAALRRELREERGFAVESARPLMTVRHSYTRFRVTLHAFDVTIAGPGGPRPPDFRGDSSVRWVSLGALDRYPFPSGSLKIVRHLQGRG
ncbi:MAG: A/G-specific adenine glycosylase [Acidobacteriota bacterium]|nr:A/G-specific adenine glycosylase [Acidobacteriota bacterium]HOF82752.1 A/G-specific adenine glycosylase [Candidatus Aminicenantes bacterium]MDD8028867.1 A/G-specific adenine glycosylase [Acidobacteriota bacterium]MDD8033391.1 A/G-specific adenine glycosylase [Acidobacteriota bacterium]MDD8037933.1 A/G-specific adenine glycosylase [Acidobacteriota bacterium]